MGSEAIPTPRNTAASSKRARLRPTRIERPNLDRTPYWQQTAPGLRPTLSRRHSLASQSLGANDLPARSQPASGALPTRQSAGSCGAPLATNPHRMPCRQSQQVEPSPLTSPNLVLHAQAPSSARPLTRVRSWRPPLRSEHGSPLAPRPVCSDPLTPAHIRRFPAEIIARRPQHEPHICKPSPTR